MSMRPGRRFAILALGVVVGVLFGTLPVLSGSPVVSPAQAAEAGFVPVSPQRVLDTRQGSPLGSAGTQVLSLAGKVPGNATAVALNVTGLRASTSTFITVWPTGDTRPPSSNVNVRPGETRPNSVIVGIGAGQSISIYNDQGSVDVLVDVMGYFTHGFTGIRPDRLMDTRNGVGGVRFGAGSTQQLKVRGLPNIPSGAVAVALNVTAARVTTDTFVTVWPGGNKPNSSNLNVKAGGTVPNLVVVGIGDNDRISLYNDQGSLDLIVDVMGWFDASGGLIPQAPWRALDTRRNTCGLRLGPGETRTVRVTSRSDRAAAVLNVTSVGATAPTFVTVWPSGSTRPTTSNLNVANADPTPNLVVVGVGQAGQISLYNERGFVNLLVDVSAMFDGTTPSPAAQIMPCPVPPPPGTAAEVLVLPSLHRAIGVDRIGVWVCDTPSGEVATTPEFVAQWANAEASPYFAEASNGRFAVTFTPLGRFSIGTDSRNTCLDEAEKRTGAPFTNVFVTDNTGYGGGFGGPGWIYGENGPIYNVFSRPPSQSGRGLYVGGGSTAPGENRSPGVLIHEIGHSLHWPHSYTGPSEYDNPADMMSGWTQDGWCEELQDWGGTQSWTCRSQHTIAFNRLAAGWIEDSQLGVHRGGTSTVMLAPPAAGATQLLVAPQWGDGRIMLTIEARPKVGRDLYLDEEGVALHIIDQRSTVCSAALWGDSSCFSLDRRQLPAMASESGSAHVLGVGQSLNVHGVTVTVIRRVLENYEVTVSGTFSPPATWPFLLPLSGVDPMPVPHVVVSDDGGRRVVLP